MCVPNHTHRQLRTHRHFSVHTPLHTHTHTMSYQIHMFPTWLPLFLLRVYENWCDGDRKANLELISFQVDFQTSTFPPPKEGMCTPLTSFWSEQLSLDVWLSRSSWCSVYRSTELPLFWLAFASCFHSFYCVCIFACLPTGFPDRMSQQFLSEGCKVLSRTPGCRRFNSSSWLAFSLASFHPQCSTNDFLFVRCFHSSKSLDQSQSRWCIFSASHRSTVPGPLSHKCHSLRKNVGCSVTWLGFCLCWLPAIWS